MWAFVQQRSRGWRSPIAKFLTAGEIAAVTQSAAGASAGDLLLLVADAAQTTAQALGALRLELARRFDLIPAGPRHAVGRRSSRCSRGGPRSSAGTPSTTRSPPRDRRRRGRDRRGSQRSERLLSRSYDLVLDGVELGGGSIRIHRTDVQERVFELIGIEQREAEARFGFLLDALRYGAPPHGGIALGLDRIVALLAGRETIREVIAFPKAASGADPLTGAPAPVDAASCANSDCG